MSYTGAGRYNEAEQYLKKCIAIGKKPGATTRCVLGDFMQCLGACYLWRGDLQQAEDVLCKAIQESCGANNENRGGALYSLGNVYYKQQRYAEALLKHREVLELYTKDLGNNHHWVADSCHKVGSILATDEFEGKDLIQAE
jgi:tetratricopeptide (TPR) repeat protein